MSAEDLLEALITLYTADPFVADTSALLLSVVDVDVELVFGANFFSLGLTPKADSALSTKSDAPSNTPLTKPPTLSATKLKAPVAVSLIPLKILPIALPIGLNAPAILLPIPPNILGAAFHNLVAKFLADVNAF